MFIVAAYSRETGSLCFRTTKDYADRVAAERCARRLSSSSHRYTVMTAEAFAAAWGAR